MPRLYRGMKEDGGFPMLGSGGTNLGVRLPDSARPDVEPDIIPDPDGMVSPAQGGMSVSPAVADLPAHAIPKRLKHRYPRATGNDKIRVWRWGDGPFIDGQMSDRLGFRLDPNNPRHGFVEPATKMPAADYIEAIDRTRDGWTIAEDE